MSNTSFEWDSAKQAFIEVPEPIDTDTSSDYEEAIRKSGYNSLELSSDAEDCVSAAIKVFRTDRDDLPRFYIDVMGQNTGLATFVAKDFLALLETLKQLHPLISLIHADQSAAAIVETRQFNSQ